MRPHLIDVLARNTCEETGAFFALCHILDMRLPELESRVEKRAVGCTTLRVLLSEQKITEIRAANLKVNIRRPA